MISFCIFFFIEAFFSFKIENLYIILVINFIFFRFFDISKIFPVSYFDNRTGAFYVMADDVVAGVMSGVVSIFILKFMHFLY
jgi:phosphatidylglycerophosphatase A